MTPSRTAKRRTPGGSAAEPQAPCLVVGYDGSDSARAAVGWAARTIPEDGRLVLVYACRALHAPPSPVVTDAQRHEVAQAVLDELALDGEDALLARDTHTEVIDEDPVSALSDAAVRHRATSIVVGGREHSRLRHAIGTVTDELLTRAPVPVTVVPAARPGD